MNIFEKLLKLGYSENLEVTEGDVLSISETTGKEEDWRNRITLSNQDGLVLWSSEHEEDKEVLRKYINEEFQEGLNTVKYFDHSGEYHEEEVEMVEIDLTELHQSKNYKWVDPFWESPCGERYSEVECLSDYGDKFIVPKSLKIIAPALRELKLITAVERILGDWDFNYNGDFMDSEQEEWYKTRMLVLASSVSYHLSEMRNEDNHSHANWDREELLPKEIFMLNSKYKYFSDMSLIECRRGAAKDLTYFELG